MTKNSIAIKAIQAVRSVRAGVLDHSYFSDNSELNAFVEIYDPELLSSDELIDLAEKADKSVRLEFIRLDFINDEARDQGTPEVICLVSALSEITELAAVVIKASAKYEDLDRRVSALEKEGK